MLKFTAAVALAFFALTFYAGAGVAAQTTEGTIEDDALVLKDGDKVIMLIRKTHYRVRCTADKKEPKQCFTIETYGDIAANVEAAATCQKEFGHPGFGLSSGKC